MLSSFLLHKDIKNNDSIAIFDGKLNITFKKLDRFVKQCATFLINQYKIQKGDTVLFSFDRSSEAIISLLALNILGCIYVPIVSEFGKERINYIINKTTPKLIIGNKGFDLFRDSALPVFNAKNLISQIASSSTDFSPFSIDEREPFCILFTSGSTGEPKGVLLNHRAFHNRIEWMQEAYPFAKDEICFQNTRFTTVDSIWEIFCPLHSGRPLVILDDNTCADPETLVQALSRLDIYRITLIPSFMDMILESYSDLGTVLPKLKMWVTSGESLLKETCIKFYAAHPEAKLYNFYGLTESSSDISHFDTSPFFLEGRPSFKFDKLDIIPIGNPIRNTYFRLRDERDQFSTDLSEGELCIIGDSLSPGYLGDVALDLQKYGNKHVEIDGEIRQERILYTGDYVRKSADGIYTLIGRMDSLINIRGYKIYPLEIETSIRKLYFINNCKITKTKNNQSLILYYIPNISNVQNEAQRRIRLFNYCKEWLPTFMVPKYFIELNSFPTTATGKVDLKSLPAPSSQYLIKRSLEIHKIPRGKVQKFLSETWASLLKIDFDQISANDDFFQMGGNSLLATQLRARISKRFGVSLSMADIFSNPRLEDLSQKIEKSETKQGSVFEHKTPKNSIPLSHSQERIWFLQQLHSGSVVNNIPFTYKLKGNINQIALEQAFNRLLSRHDILRTNLRVSLSGEATQFIHPSSAKKFNLQFTDLTQEPNTKEKSLLLIRNYLMEPFDLLQGHMLRAHLIQFASNKFILSCVIHHIVADYWSLGILIREISAYYNHIITGSTLRLELLNIQYADFINWQIHWFKESIQKEKLHFWKEELQGISQVSSIIKFNAPLVKMPRITKTHRLHINDRMGRKLNSLCKNLGVSFFMSMLAVTNLILYHKTQQSRQVIGSPIANRLHEEAEGMIGVFVNVLALKTDIVSSLSFQDFLCQIKEHMLKVYNYQDMPFEKLIHHLFPNARALNHHPLFQVMLISQDYEPVEYEFQGIESEFMAVDFPITKFDLTLTTTNLRNEDINVDFTYAPEFFSKEEIQEMANNFLSIIEQILEKPAITIADIFSIHTYHRKNSQSCVYQYENNSNLF